MKTILAAIVLGLTAFAGAQDAAQPAQQPAGSSQGPVIKDPAEYNAYVAAYQQKDPATQISGLEAFLTQYPNSVMKNQALELLMGAYQQTNNVKKTLETATKLATADTCHVRALTTLAFFERALAQQGDPNGAQLLTDAKARGLQGLDCLPKVTDPELLKNKSTMESVFHFAIGLKDLQDKDNVNAAKELKAAADASADEQKDFGLIYPLALAYLGQSPQDLINGIWYGARAVGLSPTPAVAQQVEPYLKRQYRKYHGDEDGWSDFVTVAKGAYAVPTPFPVKPAPTPAEQAHAMATSKKPEEMDFAMWEFILQNGSQDDRDMVWNAIKGKPVQLNGTIIKATADEFDVAASLDDIDAKKADITLTFEAAIPKTRIPKEAASLDFEGTPASYTPDPFMMTMEKGKLAKPAPAPAHHAAPKKPAASQ